MIVWMWLQGLTSQDMDQKLLQGPYGRILTAIKAVKDCDLRLPLIVVVGDENQGKSSTLERLARKEVFPRGEGFTTRMPVKLCMQNSTTTRTVFRHMKSLVNGQNSEIESET
eukprot:scaffold60317_cov19-Prasinocladus_malaysianus.AAC.1